MLNDTVTPEAYVLIEMRLDAMRLFIDEMAQEARDRADRCPLPTRVRPAVATDIFEGAILWYPRQTQPWFWRIVREVRDPQDAFKAYIADDGSHYGLVDAYVRDEE